MVTEKYIHRILLFLLQTLLVSRFTTSTECINGIQLDGQFDSCKCTKVGPEGHISLNCDNQRWITVPNIHKALVGHKKDTTEIVAISMKDGFLMYISQDAFRNSSAQNIDLSRNFIENVNVNAFRGLEDKLFQLLLNQNSLSAIPYHSLTYLHQLRYLYLQQNQITDIPPQTFANVKLGNLKYLHLDTNKINLIQKGALTNIPLQVLTISNNKITELEKDSIPKSLWFIDLKHNLLQHIPYLALKELKNLKTLDLESNNITHLTAHKEVNFEKEITLLLSNNKINFLPSGAFDSFTKFTKIDLSYNQIFKIDEQAFRSITKLEEINLSYNNIAHISIKTFNNQGDSLKKLNLEENELHSLPTGLKSLSALEVLNLNSNKLTDLQNNAMYKFKRNLTELLVAFNRLTAIPHDVLEGMDQLKHLDLSKNRIKEIDDIAFGSLPNLVRLNLAGNFLKKITNHHVFDSLRSLAYLDLSYNRLKMLGKTAFEKLTGLESLFLQSNSLTEFPRAALSGLDKLRYLLLDHNQIKNIPNFAVQWLTHLERLSLSRNHIQAIREKTFRAAPMQLRSLNLGYNQISELSSRAFDSLPSLEQLFLNNNQITRLLPQTITNLNALRDLTLAHNNIVEISEYTFVNLPHLEHLSLAHNHIRQIPRMAFSSTSKLEVLDLSYNNFKHFNSDFLETAIKLTILDLSHNKISRFEIANLRQNLEQLSLSHNRIQYLSSDKLDEFEVLKFIDLSFNEIIELESSCFTSCPNLAVINLSQNNLRKIWKGTFNLQHRIQQLHLSNNYLTYLDHGVFGKNNILELYLQNNNFTSIPKEALTSIRQTLTILDLSSNSIRSLERKDLIGLQNITKLILTNNKIESIDDETFADMTLIQYLDLHNNPISTWSPHAFKSISESISSINLAQTGLFSLPKITSRSLKHLNISHNKIYEIQPTDIELLKRVTILDASWNNIIEIKADIFKQMSELEYLDLTGNNLQFITADQLEYLDQLEVLKISHLKDLKQIPKPFQFSKLRNLKQLEIHNLPLSESQYNISHILQVLPPLKVIDIEIMEQELKHQLKRADLRLLRSITIRGKNLKQIAPTAFDKLRGYRLELTIRDTQITNIPALTFHTMQSISFLSLSLINNKIQKFNPFTHSKPPLLNQHGTILERINLEGNPVLCTCEMEWIRQWLEYTAEHSTQLEIIQNDLDGTECDARPGIQDTLLSVYGLKIPGIKSKHTPTITVNDMCTRYLSFNGQSYPRITPLLVILLSYLAF